MKLRTSITYNVYVENVVVIVAECHVQKGPFYLLFLYNPAQNISYMFNLVHITRHSCCTTSESAMARIFLTRIYAVLE